MGLNDFNRMCEKFSKRVCFKLDDTIEPSEVDGRMCEYHFKRRSNPGRP